MNQWILGARRLTTEWHDNKNRDDRRHHASVRSDIVMFLESVSVRHVDKRGIVEKRRSARQWIAAGQVHWLLFGPPPRSIFR